jgi:hypothetical protein
MKSRINRLVISFSVLAASLSFAAAQDTQPPQNTIMVGAGNDLRCADDQGTPAVLKKSAPASLRSTPK